MKIYSNMICKTCGIFIQNTEDTILYRSDKNEVFCSKYCAMLYQEKVDKDKNNCEKVENKNV